MPPKSKITREMIIEAGLRIVRRDGVESLNVRKVAAELECSTQPVMYHFKTVSELKAAIYGAADRLHTEYIMAQDGSEDVMLLSIGLRYIRFAAEEKNLFRLLFQSDSFGKVSFGELMGSEEQTPLTAPICEAAGISEDKARRVFEVLFICVHGAASMIANNSIEYDTEHFRELLTEVFNGAVGGIREGKL